METTDWYVCKPSGWAHYKDQKECEGGNREDEGSIVLEEHPLEIYPDKSVIDGQDPGKHYRYSFRLNLSKQDIENGFVMVNIDPYRISDVYHLGGWREHLVKKTIRGTEKGHSEEELIGELECTIKRARQMLEESKE